MTRNGFALVVSKKVRQVLTCETFNAVLGGQLQDKFLNTLCRVVRGTVNCMYSPQKLVDYKARLKTRGFYISDHIGCEFMENVNQHIQNRQIKGFYIPYWLSPLIQYVLTDCLCNSDIAA